jgi:hypothetical protein
MTSEKKSKVFFDILDNRRVAFVDKIKSYIESKNITIKNSSNKWKCDFWIPRESVEILYPNDREGVSQFLAATINTFWVPVSVKYKTVKKKDTYTGNLTKIIIGRKYAFGKCNIRNCFQRLVFTNERNVRTIKRKKKCNSELREYAFNSVKRRQLKMALKNYMNIKCISDLTKSSIFIDFETITDFQDNLELFPEAKDTSMIFMIGVGIKTERSFYFKSFTVNTLEQNEELRIIHEFYDFLEEQSKRGFKYLVHWSHAEPVLLRKLKDKWGISVPNSYSFLDLMQPFKVVYKNQSVALKKIARDWKEKGYIQTDYSNSDITDGLTAMAKIVKNWDKKILDEIEEYNKKDTVVLSELLTLI